MIKEITAKVLLNSVRQPDDWFGLKYNMNLYRGCQHQCIYCDSRSACYQIENFSDVLVKANAIDLLRAELSRKRVKGTIGTGSMNDPYMPIEAQRKLTRQALQVIAEFHYPVHTQLSASRLQPQMTFWGRRLNPGHHGFPSASRLSRSWLKMGLKPG